MEQTTNLKMPFIMPSQAQKHVTHNEALIALDALVQLSVLDRHVAAAPAAPSEGDRYIVAPAPTGAWSGKPGQIAAWQDGAWTFYEPVKGWLAWVEDEQRLFAFDGTTWVDAVALGANPVPMVGVNAAADATNRLSVKSPAVLFDNQGASHQVKINKATAGDTASLLFQTGYSGRAEFGLTGDDDWHVKVSPDGIAWTEALKVNRTDGRVLLSQAPDLTDDNQVVTKRNIRERLAANRVYYVRTDGSDANNGLANTSGGAFQTIQKALNAAAGIDFGGFAVTVQIADGTYAGAVSLPATTGQGGAGSLVLAGNGAAPGNVVITATSASAVTASAGTRALVRDLELRTTSAGYGLNSDGGAVQFQNVRFGACAQGHLACQKNGVASAVGNYAIGGAAPVHWLARSGGIVDVEGRTVTLSGSPAFASAFASCQGGDILCSGMTFAGAATGPRYSVTQNGCINAGGGANYLPGNAAGSSATGGQYV